MMRWSLLASSLLMVGCQMTPIPSSIEKWHEQAKREVPVLEPVLKEGDVLFRLSKTEVLGGLVDFSRTIADATESDLSHASLVYRMASDGVIVVDITPTGISRRYLVDWFHDGTSNVVVRRLKPEYQYLIPRVLAEADRLITRDVMYDDKFVADDDRFYCTEMVDYCFRATGHPLSARIRIKDLPRYGLFMHIGCLVGGIDSGNEVVIAGNERIGLFSSAMLETVIDLRSNPAGPLPGPDTELASYQSDPPAKP